jgi:TPR repeat protein
MEAGMDSRFRENSSFPRKRKSRSTLLEAGMDSRFRENSSFPRKRESRSTFMETGMDSRLRGDDHSSNRADRLRGDGVITNFFAALAAGLVLALGIAPLASATTDSPSTLVALATSYEHGEGVPQDMTRAASLYCEAARDGDAEAQFSLGWMYANGRGVDRDDSAAAALFTLAATQGHEYARRMLEHVGVPGERVPECMTPKPKIPEFVVPADWPPHKRKVAALVQKLAPEYAVHPGLALAVIQAESNFDPRARSSKNAQGLMQLIPKTAQRFGVRNALDPKDNVRGGLAYLRWLLSYYRGNVVLTLAAYNAGEKVVDRFKGVPPYPETQGYVRRIMSKLPSDQHPFDDTLTNASPMLPVFVTRGTE